MPYLIFDIETIPDLSVWTPPPAAAPPVDPAAPLPGQTPLALVGVAAVPPHPGDGGIIIPPAGTKKPRASRKKPVDPNAPVKDPFPPLYAHRVVALGYCMLDDNFMPAGLGVVGTKTHGDNEAAILEGWNGYVNQLRPTIVTFSGRSFDIPVLSLRAFRLGVAQSWADKDYRYRYGDRHIDVFDRMTEYGLVPRTGYGLGTFAKLMGLPGKTSEGENVQGMFNRGEIDKLEAYCAADAVITAFVLLRYFLMTGRLPKEQYQKSASALLQTCVSMGLGSVAFGVDSKRLLLEG
jgi:predicted PolB exonuclease-like 3'-5' exonuclease